MAHEDLVRPRVMTTVEDLVAREASGVLEVAGSPAGAIYLDGGRIAFARASWVPGLAGRLRAIGTALPGPGAAPAGGDADDAAVAGYAVQHGYLSPAGLHELIRSIVVDAFLVLTFPLVADSPVAAIRFTSTRTYWTETFPRLDLELVRGQAHSRARRIAQHGLSPATPVALRELPAPVAVLSREQWSVLGQIGEYATARDVAARRGASLSDTLDCLGSLTRAGLCTPVRVPRPVPVRVPRPVSGPTRVAPETAGAPYPAPARQPGAESLSGPVPPSPSPPPPGPGQAVSPGGAAPAAPSGPPERMPPGHLPPGHLPPGHLPPGYLPPRRAARTRTAERPAATHQGPTIDVLRQVLSGLRKL